MLPNEIAGTLNAPLLTSRLLQPTKIPYFTLSDGRHACYASTEQASLLM